MSLLQGQTYMVSRSISAVSAASGVSNPSGSQGRTLPFGGVCLFRHQAPLDVFSWPRMGGSCEPDQAGVLVSHLCPETSGSKANAFPLVDTLCDTELPRFSGFYQFGLADAGSSALR